MGTRNIFLEKYGGMKFSGETLWGCDRWVPGIRKDQPLTDCSHPSDHPRYNKEPALLTYQTHKVSKFRNQRSGQSSLEMAIICWSLRVRHFDWYRFENARNRVKTLGLYLHLKVSNYPQKYPMKAHNKKWTVDRNSPIDRNSPTIKYIF